MSNCQYYNGKAITGNQDFDDGSSYRDAYKALSNYGFTDENLWPYDRSKFSEQPPQEAYTNANKNLIKRYLSLTPCLYAIQYAISQNLPVAFGTMIYENFKDLSEDFIVPLPSGKVLGGHALCIYQYDNTTKLFGIINSWGVEFGKNGICYMRYEHVLNQEWSFDFWVITK